METGPAKFVDIEKVLKEKAPGLYRWLPGFAVSWLKRKLHEEDINGHMWALRDERGLKFNRLALERLGVNVSTIRGELIPREGAVTICANHPLGGLDGMALIKVVGDVRPDVHFFVNDILKNISNYGEVFVAVNKLGSVSTGSLRTIDSIYKMGGAVLVFPAGLVSRKQQGEIRDLSWKKSFVTQAIDHRRMVQPAFIEGRNSSFFYNFANLRKRLGVRANIEMLFLPDEMFSAKKKNFGIHFSRPFSYELLDKSRSHKEWADLLYRYTYSPELREGIAFEEYLKKQRKP